MTSLDYMQSVELSERIYIVILALLLDLQLLMYWVFNAYALLIPSMHSTGNHNPSNKLMQRLSKSWTSGELS